MHPHDRTLTIGEVAQLADTTPRTIRYYHHQGLLPEPARDSAGRRVYRLAQVARLLWVRKLTWLGLSLAEIRDILVNDDDLSEILAGLDAALAAQQHRIAQQRELIRQLRETGNGAALLTTEADPALRELLARHHLAPAAETLEHYLILEKLLGADEVARTALSDALIAGDSDLSARAAALLRLWEELGDADPSDPRVAQWAREQAAFAETAEQVERAAGIDTRDDEATLPDPNGPVPQLALAAFESGTQTSPAQQRAMELYLDQVMAGE